MKFRRLPEPERALQLESAWRLAQSVVFLKLFGFRRALAAANPGLRRGAPSPDPEAAVDAAALAVERASRAMRIGNCLSKSLALYGILQRNGIETRLRIGVDMELGTVPAIAGAHAWLEHDGKPLGAHPPGPAYDTVFPPIDPARPPVRTRLLEAGDAGSDS